MLPKRSRKLVAEVDRAPAAHAGAQQDRQQMRWAVSRALRQQPLARPILGAPVRNRHGQGFHLESFPLNEARVDGVDRQAIPSRHHRRDRGIQGGRATRLLVKAGADVWR